MSLHLGDVSVRDVNDNVNVPLKLCYELGKDRPCRYNVDFGLLDFIRVGVAPLVVAKPKPDTGIDQFAERLKANASRDLPGEITPEDRRGKRRTTMSNGCRVS